MQNCSQIKLADGAAKKPFVATALCGTRAFSKELTKHFVAILRNYFDKYNEQVGVEELTEHFVAILRKLHVIYSILSSKTLDTVAVNVEGGVVSSCIYTGPDRQAC